MISSNPDYRETRVSLRKMITKLHKLYFFKDLVPFAAAELMKAYSNTRSLLLVFLYAEFKKRGNKILPLIFHYANAALILPTAY